MSEALTVERLAGPDALDEIAAEWSLLARQASPRTPFASPAWIISWWKHFPRPRQALFHDDFYCHAVRGADGRLVAVAPLIFTSMPGVGPPLLRVVQFVGVDASLTEFRGLVCRPEDQTRAVLALVEHFLARRSEWDVFRWAGLRECLGVYGALSPACAFAAREDVADFIVDLPATWEGLRQRVSSNMRKNIRKPYEALERDGFAIALRVTERPDGVGAAMARFLALHEARSNAAGMIVHPNKFVKPHVRSFLAGYLRGAAERGELRIFELEIAGEVVAVRIAFLIGSDLYLYYAGYDPAWKSFSVMTVLMVEMFKWAFSHGVERVNLSTGEDQSKARWKPREVRLRSAVQVSPTWRAWAARGAFHIYEAAARARHHAVGRRAGGPELPARPADTGNVASSSVRRTVQCSK